MPGGERTNPVSPRLLLLLVAAVPLAGCATRTASVAPPLVVATIPAAAPAMPAGGYPGMVIPAALPDGRYPTPNLAASEAAAVWHLRGALNVAALACRDGGDVLAASYNGWIRAQKATLAAAERSYAGEWRAAGGDAQDRYDDAMTRLYNFYGQPAMRPEFCAAAGSVLAEVAAVPAAGLAGYARGALARLDRPFTDFYAAFDAWRGRGTSGATLALAATPASGPAAVPPRLEVDPAVLLAP